MKYHYLIVGFTDVIDHPFIQEGGIVERAFPLAAIRAVTMIHTDLHSGQCESDCKDLGHGSFLGTVNATDAGKKNNLGVTVLLQTIE